MKQEYTIKKKLKELEDNYNNCYDARIKHELITIIKILKWVLK